MLTVLFDKFIESLSPDFGEAEARSISRIFFEDDLNWHPGKRDREANPEEKKRINEVQQRLLVGEPIQYILGQTDFFGLKFKVSPAVLIPRPETEELVDWILSAIPPTTPLKVLDIGTGSACIPISLKIKRPKIEAWALDISAVALAISQENAELNQVKLHLMEGDILDPSYWEQLPVFDIIISNPPYIPEREKQLMTNTVLDYEPHLALFVRDDQPLIFYDQIARFAQRHLTKNGQLYFECNEFNAQEVKNLLEAMDYKVELKQDLQGKDRMVKARASFF